MLGLARRKLPLGGGGSRTRCEWESASRLQRNSPESFVQCCCDWVSCRLTQFHRSKHRLTLEPATEPLLSSAPLHHLLLTMIPIIPAGQREMLTWSSSVITSQATLATERQKKKGNGHRCNLLIMHTYSRNWKDIIPLLYNGSAGTRYSFPSPS